ncbi:hypothetical protein ACP6EK_04605 [Candidatus Caldatribacterium sp. SIUC1]|uniref:hypothetical protein n=1 Tax=Candidatus Caldatribacterium sp. SIUC1 TaxID=3418365 RepID=UPI003F6903D4
MLLAFLSLVVLAYLLPFTVLSRVQRFSGSFLFWSAFAVLAILLLLRMMRSWHE